MSTRKFTPRTQGHHRVDQSSIPRHAFKKPPCASARPPRDSAAPKPLLHAFVVSSHGQCLLHHEHDPTVLRDYNNIIKTVPRGIELVMMCPVGYTTSNTAMAQWLVSDILRQRERGDLRRQSPNGRRNARRFLSPGDPYVDVALELGMSDPRHDVIEPGVYHRDLRRDSPGDPLTNLKSLGLAPPRNNRVTMLSDILADTIRPLVGAQSRALVVVDACRTLRTGHATEDPDQEGCTVKRNGVSVVARNNRSQLMHPKRPRFFEDNEPDEDDRRAADLYDKVMGPARLAEELADIAFRMRAAKKQLTKALKSVIAERRRRSAR